ncbi:glycosyltransferase family 2 protein [Paenibacillus piri]|uniref:glycosyltransferase family 2 protein n=1 Tax=Paenibacillus piri TaxID=2547395 RepID=UPI001404A916|nr:glycosyltransferase [Paenibacillus piri]
MNDGISIIIPTFNGGEIFKQCLNSLVTQEYSGEIQIIVIDSGSKDETVHNAIAVGAEVTIIDSKDFHHSRTRNQAVKLAKHAKVILMVQDAIPIGNKWIQHLTDSFNEYDIVAAYGKQVPHMDADLFARFEVDYHSQYLGDKPVIQSIESMEILDSLSFDDALRRIRFDNVCAIYSRDHLLKYPFPDVPFGEDMAWAMEVMKNGHKVLYNPEVKVHHSHNRSSEYRFKRAIIDTIVCAEILGRTKQDLSFLDYNDVMVISKETTDLINEMYNEVTSSKMDNTLRQNTSYLRSVFKNSLIKKFVWIAFKNLKRGSFDKVLKLGIKKTFENHMRYVLSYIKENYPNCKNEELLSVIDQIAASMQGGLFGEVYVSHKANGNIPSNLEEMITANSRGV